VADCSSGSAAPLQGFPGEKVGVTLSKLVRFINSATV
jgi:hypothetical protein